MSKELPSILRVRVMSSTVLGVNVFRGFAPLCDLAKVSRADIYDQKRNPLGTQRDLSPAHARQAYEYVMTKPMAFWPEVFLCARESQAYSFVPDPGEPNLGVLTVRESPDPSLVWISRVDGNHRLHFADGHAPGMPPIEKVVSFCLAYGLSRQEEIQLFRDINNNQRRMSTSHLDTIEVMLTPEERLKREDPALYVAKRLGSDARSPLFERIYEGGAKSGAWSIPLHTLKTGVEYLYSRSTRIGALPDVEAQYELIKTFFSALRKWVPQAWSEPRKYLLLRGAGLWAACFIGADVIDKVINAGKWDSDSMLNVLSSGKSWDWAAGGDFTGYSGRGGASEIASKVLAELSPESGVSLKELSKRIVASSSD